MKSESLNVEKIASILKGRRGPAFDTNRTDSGPSSNAALRLRDFLSSGRCSTQISPGRPTLLEDAGTEAVLPEMREPNRASNDVWRIAGA